MKRLFDIVFSVTGIILLLPVFIITGIWIMLDSRGGVFYRQMRVGQGGKDFGIFKFRTMHTGADKKGLLTVGGRDPRVTPAGYYLRRYKLDELPQLFNVLKGDMSMVGPRPEVRKYVDMYNDEQKGVLEIKPGITDLASIEYSDENDLLSKAANPEEEYIRVIMPHKLRLNLKYIQEKSLLLDLKIIGRTVAKIFG